MPKPLQVDRLHLYAGSRLRELREKLGLSQDALGQLVDASREMVNYWESGKYAPSAVKVAKLATVLNCDPDDLFITRNLSAEG